MTEAIEALLPLAANDPDFERYRDYSEQAYTRALKGLNEAPVAVIVIVRSSMLGFLPVQEKHRLVERLDEAVLVAGKDFKKGRAFERAKLFFYDIATETAKPIRIEPLRITSENEFH